MTTTPFIIPENLSETLLTPSLIIDLDRVRSNVARVIDLMGGDPDRWRPHVKTVKIPLVFRHMAAAGLRHYKCATTREASCLAATLAEEGVHDADILVAYPLAGPMLDRLGEVAQRFPMTRFAVIVEAESVIAHVPDDVGIFVDINFGMDRTGIPVTETATIHAVAGRAGPRLAGVHAYEGHLGDLDDAARVDAARTMYAALVDVVNTLIADGIRVPEVVTSGTPSFRDALACECFATIDAVHRVSPGTVVYHDARSDERCGGLDLLPAAVIATRVISHPAKGIVTCDAGSKTIAADAGDPCATVEGWPGLVPMRQTEEHLPIRVVSGPVPARGALLILVPRHICPAVNLAEEAVVLEDGQLHGVVDVAARAHERQAFDEAATASCYPGQASP